MNTKSVSLELIANIATIEDKDIANAAENNNENQDASALNSGTCKPTCETGKV